MMKRVFLVLVAAASLCFQAIAWTTTPTLHFVTSRIATNRRLLKYSTATRQSRLFSSTKQETELATTTTSESSEILQQEEEEEEWEYLEYDDLQESDFVNSEWLVGTVLDNNPTKIQETWARCIMSDDAGASSQPCVWGDGSKGKWSFDRASQYFSLSKEHFYGKEIWAGVVDDYYYLQGTVRGWTYITAAEVLGQWQAKRLSVDPDEAGIAPWFEEDSEDGESDNGDDESSTKLMAKADETVVETEAATEKNQEVSDSDSSAKVESPSEKETSSKE